MLLVLVNILWEASKALKYQALTVCNSSELHSKALVMQLEHLAKMFLECTVHFSCPAARSLVPRLSWNANIYPAQLQFRVPGRGSLGTRLA